MLAEREVLQIGESRMVLSSTGSNSNWSKAWDPRPTSSVPASLESTRKPYSGGQTIYIYIYIYIWMSSCSFMAVCGRRGVFIISVFKALFQVLNCVCELSLGINTLYFLERHFKSEWCKLN